MGLCAMCCSSGHGVLVYMYILGLVREQDFGGGECVGMRFKHKL